MVPPSARQGTGRVTLWVIAGLVLAFVVLAGYHFYSRRHREFRDPRLEQELRAAPLPEVLIDPAKVGTWPQWRGPNRDGWSADTGLPLTWPKDGPTVLWKGKTGPGYSSVAVAGGRVYTLLQDEDQEVVVCWDADTSEIQWRWAYPARFQNEYGGPRSTPTVDGNFVYTVGGTGIFHCLEAATGQVVWRHDLLDEFGASNLPWGVSFSPLVEGDLIYTMPGGPNGNSLAAFDKRSGRLVWKALDDKGGYSSPVAATICGVRQIICFTQTGLVSVSPQNGTLYWRYPWETPYDCNTATPIVVGDYVFISSGYNRGCTLLKIAAQGSSMQAQRVYEHTQMCNHFSTCVYYKEHLYGFNEGTLTCMEFRTGKVRWKERGFQKGSLLGADGHLIILSENGKLAVAQAAPDRYLEKASWKALSGRCWSMPALAGGKLYIRNEEEIKCVDLRGP
jgi:outer membrane protein assembly factor BamB